MLGIIRQCEQYGLAEPRDIYASVPEREIAELLRPGVRVHTGTMNYRSGHVSRETPVLPPHLADLSTISPPEVTGIGSGSLGGSAPDTDPNHGSRDWEDFSKKGETPPHLNNPYGPMGLPGGGMTF